MQRHRLSSKATALSLVLLGCMLLLHPASSTRPIRQLTGVIIENYIGRTSVALDDKVTEMIKVLADKCQLSNLDIYLLNPPSNRDGDIYLLNPPSDRDGDIYLLNPPSEKSFAAFAYDLSSFPPDPCTPEKLLALAAKMGLPMLDVLGFASADANALIGLLDVPLDDTVERQISALDDACGAKGMLLPAVVPYARTSAEQAVETLAAINFGKSLPPGPCSTAQGLVDAAVKVGLASK